MGKKIGIYIFSDCNGIADGYVKYALKELKKNTDELFVYAVFGIDEKSRQAFGELCEIHEGTQTKYADKAAGNSSYGNCRMAFQSAGVWDRLADLEEIILMDDSVFGPFYDISRLLAQFRDSSCEFAGVYQMEERLEKTGELKFAALEDSFLWFGRNLIQDRHFADFFASGNQQYDAVSLGEALVDFFPKWGFSYGTYIDSSRYVAGELQYNFDYNLYGPYQLVAVSKSPFLKKSAFIVRDSINVGLGDELRQVFAYIKEHGQYQTDLIWEHILRIYSIADLRWTMHLNYILPDEAQQGAGCIQAGSAVVMMHLYYQDLLMDNLRYIQKIPESMDVIISTIKDERTVLIREYMRNIGRDNYILLASGEQGRDAAALLVAGRKHLLKYDYICFLHDKKTSDGRGGYLVGDAFQRLVWDNLTGSKERISRILALFYEEPRLGMLVPPVPMMADYLKYSFGSEWTNCYEGTVALGKKLGLSAAMDKDKPPFTLSTCFWAKKDALLPLLDRNWQYTDFPEEPLANDGTLNHCIERILGYVVQNEGFYTAQIMNNGFAEVYMDNLLEITAGIYRMLRKYRLSGSADDLEHAFLALDQDFILEQNQKLKDLQEKYQWYQNDNFRLRKQLVDAQAKYQWFYQEGEDLRKQLVDAQAKYQWFYQEGEDLRKQLVDMEAKYQWFYREGEDLRKQLVDMEAKYQWFYNESIEYQNKYHSLKQQLEQLNQKHQQEGGILD